MRLPCLPQREQGGLRNVKGSIISAIDRSTRQPLLKRDVCSLEILTNQHQQGLHMRAHSSTPSFLTFIIKGCSGSWNRINAKGNKASNS